MKFLPLLWRTLLRRKVRTAFTFLSIAVALLRLGDGRRYWHSCSSVRRPCGCCFRDTSGSSLRARRLSSLIISIQRT